jgi:hypothetical protein
VIDHPGLKGDVMGATRSPNQAKAARVARELMKSFDVGDLHGLISEHLNYPKDTERLYAAVDPRYYHLEKERFKLLRILENALRARCRLMATIR